MFWDNLLYIADHIRNVNPTMKLWIRTPLIPGITSDFNNIESIGAYIKDHLSDVIERWEMCAFNGACAVKYAKLGATWQFDGLGAMSNKEIQPIREIAHSLLTQEKVLVFGMIRSG